MSLESMGLSDDDHLPAGVVEVQLTRTELALSECAEQLPNMKHGAPLTETPKFLRMYLAHSLQPTARLYTAATSLHDAVNKHVAFDDRTSLGAAFEEMDNAMAAALEAGAAQAVPELVTQLREYAGNPGYSHSDYADAMRQAADALDTTKGA